MTTLTPQKPYPSDISDDEWAFVAPYLSLIREDVPPRHHALREVFNGLRWLVRTGSLWRWLPHDLPPWDVVYQPTQRWLRAGCFETIVHDLREVLHLAVARATMGPSAAKARRYTRRLIPWDIFWCFT